MVRGPSTSRRAPRASRSPSRALALCCALAALATAPAVRAAPAGTQGAGGFAPRADVVVGASPYAVALGDLDGDGILDLVSANSGANSVSVLRGNGTGGFGPRTDYPVGRTPRALALADLDGDGDLDVVVANLTSGTVSVLLGDGAGHLGARTDHVTGSMPYSVVVADLDGDGRPDVATADYGAGTVSVLAGDGAGGLAAPVPYATGASPFALAAADLNGDGRADLAVSNAGAGTVSVLLGSASGALQPGGALPTAVGPRQLAIRDLNGDGHPDIVVAATSSDRVSVFLGTGTGGFALGEDSWAGTGPRGVIAADLFGDPRPELAVTNPGTGAVTLLHAVTANTFAVVMSLTAGSAPAALAAGDLDRDGLLDLAVANSGDSTVSVFMAQPGGISGVTITTLGSSANPAPRHAPVALIATVLPVLAGAPLPSGDVSFGEGTTVLGTATLKGDVATLTLSSLAPGTHVLHALFAGSPGLLASESAPFPQTILSLEATTCQLSTSTNPAPAGSAVRLTATVRAVQAAGSPGGTVSFRDGATLLGTSPLDGSGSAAFSATFATPGDHPITASYGGDPVFAGSVSPVYSLSVHGTTPTQTTLTSGPSPAPRYANVTLRVLVTTVPPGGHPTGTVGFYDGTAFLGEGTLVGDSTALVTASLGPGTHSLHATYGGDFDRLKSESSPIVQVILALKATQVVLTSNPNPTVPGANDTLRARVVPIPPGSGVPSGAVEFFDGATSLGTGTLSSGVARRVTRYDSLGIHSITAHYLGDTAFAESRSAVLAHSVASLTQTVLTSNGSPILKSALVLLARVVPLLPGAGTPTGSVSFFDGGLSLGTVALAGDSAVLGAPTLGYGSHSLHAVYSGDSSFVGSTSPDLAQVVAGATTTTLSASPNPVAPGWTLTLGATVASVPPAAAAPGGVVSFYDGATLLAAKPLSDGSVAFTMSAPSIGDHALTALYPGAGICLDSKSPVVVLRVVGPEPRILAVRDVPADQGRQVRVTVLRGLGDVPVSQEPIVHYEVFRRIDPASAAAARSRGAGPSTSTLAGWDAVGMMGAYGDSLYSMVVPTLVDSNGAGPHFATFLVRAATATPARYFDSAADSGYSVDNLPPAAPTVFAGERSAGVTRLRWSGNRELDLAGYQVHRGADAGFVPGPATLLATTSDTAWTDPGPPGGCYKLCAVDLNGNESAFADLPASAIAGDPGALRLALLGARPNPARASRMNVEFTLPDGSPARLELLDVVGRRLAALEVGALGPGRHVVDLGAGRRVPPGVYVVRLARGGVTLTRRLAALE